MGRWGHPLPAGPPWDPTPRLCPCRIPELAWGAQGVYVCRASAPGGQAEDRATLTVQGKSITRALGDTGTPRPVTHEHWHAGTPISPNPGVPTDPISPYPLAVQYPPFPYTHGHPSTPHLFPHP